jgi:hypothetical protein
VLKERALRLMRLIAPIAPGALRLRPGPKPLRPEPCVRKQELRAQLKKTINKAATSLVVQAPNPNWEDAYQGSLKRCLKETVLVQTQELNSKQRTGAWTAYMLLSARKSGHCCKRDSCRYGLPFVLLE